MKLSAFPFVLLILFVQAPAVWASVESVFSIFAWKDEAIVRLEQSADFEGELSYFWSALQAQLEEETEGAEAGRFTPFLGLGTKLKSFEIVNREAIAEIEAPGLSERFLDEEVRLRFSWLLDEWIQYSPELDSVTVRLFNDSGVDFLILNETQPLLSKPEAEIPAIGRQIASFQQTSLQGNAQPTGALSDASIFLSPGHGWHYSAGKWTTQRGNNFQIIEDHSNGEAVLQYLHQYLWNAGARVYTARERDLNTNMVIVQNGGTGYSEAGAWVSEPADGAYGGNHRRAVTVVGEPTATARFTPDIPEAGYYAVYVWYRRAASEQLTTDDARIEIHHTGDTTTWIQNQDRDGFTWKYIGTYYFDEGIHPETGSVVITNQSSVAGRHVMANAVRFGGGMGDIADNVSGTISGKPRWEESGRYYAGFLGKSDWASSNQVAAMPRWAAWEHEPWESGKSVYVAWHTNAASGEGTGTETFAYSRHGWNGAFTGVPGGDRLRNFIHDHVVRDARALWKPNWVSRNNRTANLGEINPSNNSLMPAALVEIAFHDREEDAKYILDPEFRRDMARAVYKGLVQFYYNELPGFNNPTYLPEPPRNFRVSGNSDGSVELSWIPPIFGTGANSSYGHAATGYRVYRSKNGYGFDNGLDVSGTSATLTGFVPGETVFLRVAATNAGGESFPTSTLAVRIPDVSEKKVLIVNGFTRNDRFMNYLENDPNSANQASRGYLDRLNTNNYIIPHARAIESYPEIVGFDSAEVSAVEAAPNILFDYDGVVWMAGLQADVNDIGSTETPAFRPDLFGPIANYLSSGGKLFLSGAHIASDLDRRGSNSWLRAILRTNYKQAIAASEVEGLFDSILSSWNARLGGHGYRLTDSDMIEPVGGSRPTAVYSGTNAIEVDGFETAGNWWQPQTSGSTRGAGTFAIVGNPVYDGSGAARLTYDWTPGNFLRFHNPARTPFSVDSKFSIWVYGDNSGHRFRISVQDSDGDLFASPYVTLDFTGWREIVWEDIRNNSTRWAGNGDGVVNGPTVGFESLQLEQAVGGPLRGTIYVDYALATPVLEGEEQVAAIEYDDNYRLFYLAFPFEKIAGEGDRNLLMTRVLDFFRFNLTPFESWQERFFSESELADPEISGKLADLVGDGIPNLLKYALNLDPHVSSRDRLPEVKIEGEKLTLRYSRAKRATDLNFIVEVSEDLVVWKDGENEVEIVSVVDAGEIERVTVRDKKPFPESGRRFIRLRVESID